MFEVRLQTCYCVIILIQRPQFITNETYHIYNRGAEKRTFLNEKYYRRFIRDMEEFNDIAPATNLHHLCLKSDFKKCIYPQIDLRSKMACLKIRS